MRTIQLRSDSGSDPVEVSVQAAPDGDHGVLAVEVGSRPRQVMIDQLGSSAGLLRIGGCVLPFHAVKRGSTIQVWMRGRTWNLEVVERTARRVADADAAAAKATLTAPMPGTILSIKVGAGEPFEAHEPLIVMESMKMEMTLSAPHAGRVAEVLCGEGQLVEMNAVLARLEGGEGVRDERVRG